MTDSPQIVDWLIPLGSTVLGALLGAVLSLGVAYALARRERRARYGESLVAALVSARQKYAAAQTELSAAAPDGSATLKRPLNLHEDAAAVRSRAALLATLERRDDARRAIQAWAYNLHESLLAGVTTLADVQTVLGELWVAEDVVVAWITGEARGVDFKLPKEKARRFGPRFTDADFPWNN